MVAEVGAESASDDSKDVPEGKFEGLSVMLFSIARLSLSQRVQWQAHENQ